MPAEPHVVGYLHERSEPDPGPLLDPIRLCFDQAIAAGNSTVQSTSLSSTGTVSPREPPRP